MVDGYFIHVQDIHFVGAIAQFGLSLTVDDVLSLGKNILKVEREFNKRAGFTKADDRLPEFFSTDVLEPHKTTFDITDEELDEVHNY